MNGSAVEMLNAQMNANCGGVEERFFACREFPFVPSVMVTSHQLGLSRTALDSSLDRQLTPTANQSIRRTDTSSLCALGTPPSSLSSHFVSGSDEKPDRKRELIPERSMEYP